MAITPVDNLFGTSTKSIRVFFSEGNSAFYIPFYQREYSWGEGNIEQLIEDLSGGVAHLVEMSSENEKSQSIRFMGTVILLNETSPFPNIRPIDNKAMPGKVKKVIDGQQRISTISLIATHIYSRIQEHMKVVENPRSHDIKSCEKDLKEVADNYKKKLLKIFSVDIERGSPEIKPIIIRGSIDEWTLNGDDDKYKSEIAFHTARFIRNNVKLNAVGYKSSFKSSKMRSIEKSMATHIRKIEEAHLSKSTVIYPPSWKIIANFEETDLWLFERDDLKKLILGFESKKSELSKSESAVSSLVQLFMLAHFLLERCCLNLIEPTNEDWAFDMFQSLNATGTPLTAVETFKPNVVNISDKFDGGYSSSKIEKYFNDIDDLLSAEKSPEGKGKVTNDLLIYSGLLINGSKVVNQFSLQRKFLVNSYPSSDKQKNEREDFIEKMSSVAKYMTMLKQLKNRDYSIKLSGLKLDEINLLTTCLLYLSTAGHKLSLVAISNYYNSAINGEEAEHKEFFKIVLATTAFFTLWRAASDNSTLDDVYRDLAKEHLSMEAVQEHGTIFTSDDLIEYFKSKLRTRNIETKDDWKARAVTRFNYSDASMAVCRFSLLILAQRTKKDPNSPGLLIMGSPNVQTYLNPESWLGKEFATVEHIAPQSNTKSWDAEIYKNEAYDLIGNLTLLPVSLNSSAGNKSWLDKRYYYEFVNADTELEREKIRLEAKNNNIVFSDEILGKLMISTHSDYLRSILDIPSNGNWDLKIIESRTEVISDIIWEYLNKWLS